MGGLASATAAAAGGLAAAGGGGGGTEDTTPLRRALTAGLFPHAARLHPDGSYRVFLHPSSVLLERKPDCLVFNELMHTTRTYAREALAIEARWLPELAPAFFAAKAGAAVGAV
ncbi:hypothetical protein Agub_g14311 [Astrephomene gubernaculifera]|uniref:DEAD-box helicase OB fold domain-containing protein n=1 Tax=Astrephomene gubernaculifera TaxID=47775 RepID=A0AAD3HS66_9CHLO|nr:hypothetical protein Agub_g14311 [Astrephomene gubernaculifera]